MLCLFENRHLLCRQSISNLGGFKNINLNIMVQQDLDFLKNIKNEDYFELLSTISKKVKLSSYTTTEINQNFNLNLKDVYTYDRLNIKNY